MALTEDTVQPKQLLELNDDVLYHICLAVDEDDKKLHSGPHKQSPVPSALLSFCTTCRQIRYIGKPLIFRKAVVTDCRNGRFQLASLDPWLTFMENCEPFVQHLKTLHFKIVRLTGKDAARLRNIIQRAPKLKELEVISGPIGHYDTQRDTQRSFLRLLRACTLPSLKKLILSAGFEEIIPGHDSITSLELINGEIFSVPAHTIQEYAKSGYMRNLRDIGLDETIDWSPVLLETLSNHLPELQRLGVIRGGKPGYSFEALLRSPGLFPQLKELSVTFVHRLGLRYFDAKCVSRRNGCKPPIRFCPLHIRHALVYAGRVAFTACRRLQILQFASGEVAYCVRARDGSAAHICIDDGNRLASKNADSVVT